MSAVETPAAVVRPKIFRDKPWSRHVAKFDRHEAFYSDEAPSLYAMRSKGRQRHKRMKDGERPEECCSNSLFALRQAMQLVDSPPSWNYVDFACGDSPDAQIMAELGHNSHAVDVVSRTHGMHASTHRFLRWDMCRTGFFSGQVMCATCHAAVDLLNISDRYLFYKEMNRVLCMNGLFSISYYPLALGYGGSMKEEKQRLLLCGFRYISNYKGSLVFRKFITL